jgi:uncharacterized repeat protein (TIGR03987 family)
MPVNIMIAVFSIIAALVLYTIGVLGAFRNRIMGVRNLRFIWIGFAFDTLATTIMAIQAKGMLNDFHTILGLVGMFGMLAVAILVTWAIYRLRDDILTVTARWALAPWVVWFISFIWGMVVRGAARMIH